MNEFMNTYKEIEEKKDKMNLTLQKQADISMVEFKMLNAIEDEKLIVAWFYYNCHLINNTQDIKMNRNMIISKLKKCGYKTNMDFCYFHRIQNKTAKDIIGQCISCMRLMGEIPNGLIAHIEHSNVLK